MLVGRSYRCTRTGVHDKGVLHNKYGHRRKHAGACLLKLEFGLKLGCCAQGSAFCEESNGDSEDARR
eukprot:850470-Heterocapsa_arctica.AAC.1